MKLRSFASIGTSVLCSLLLLLSPLAAVAETDPEPEILDSPIIITEVQTGAKTASDEFVELHNLSDVPVDITGWQIRFSAVSTPDSTVLLAAVGVDSDTPIVLGAGAHYVFKFSSADASILADQTYQTALTKTDKSLALFEPNLQTCLLEVRDAVAWAESANAAQTRGEGRPLAVTGSKDRHLARYVDVLGEYVDSSDNLNDFAIEPAAASGASAPPIALGATPGNPNVLTIPQVEDSEVVGSMSPLADVQIEDCTLPDPEEPPVDPPVDSPPSTTIPPDDEETDEGEGQAPLPVIPAANVGLKPPQMSELLPNPASPQTDANDEFIELFNPNDATFDLSGYVLETGLTTKRRYTIPAGTTIGPKTFLVFFAADTSLALSNSGGQAVLLDPLGGTLSQSDPYGTAKDGQAWLLAGGKWQWTTRPTPNALNALSTPVVKTASTAKSSKKSTSKTAAAKTVVSPKGQNSDQDIQDTAVLTATTSTPLHPGVLALIGVSALLYGAYEYRRDVANRIYQFRSNRIARRALRESPKGR